MSSSCPANSPWVRRQTGLGAPGFRNGIAPNPIVKEGQSDGGFRNARRSVRAPRPASMRVSSRQRDVESGRSPPGLVSRRGGGGSRCSGADHLAGQTLQRFTLDRIPLVARHLDGGALQRLQEFGFERWLGLPLLGIADEGAQVLAGGSIFSLSHLSLNERSHLVGSEMFMVVIGGPSQTQPLADRRRDQGP